MAQVKVRIELNKGRKGAPLEKLGDVSRQLDRFLRALAADLKLDVKRGDWLAVNFRNGSISWDVALQEEVSDAQARRFTTCLEFIADFDSDSESTNGLVSENTLLQYSKLGEHIDPDEVIGIGMYSPERRRLKWRRIDYRRASRIRRAIEEPLVAYGSIQGALASVILEGRRPYFTVRELASDQTVRCYYDLRLYDEVVRALSQRNAIIHASGDLRLDRATRAVGEMEVERIDRIEPLTDEEFRAFIGMAPDLTGQQSTQEYITEHRGG